ncbi:ADP-ribosylglycohydrolase family protein [Cryptosporangium aurantiacum]|uniref:ADP-ribosylglycohydrolase n=1 Tax=Cryptosporangium aurantiacum TaxID=134849 RepID=A0A1M7TVJ9_9ACTN|nr:ADP-ribosylglycohydrolase family protein [Cryptosporangium aurantiacum]SHN74728.1 ADP-ribosylglycohydrolase [Cryptosporangium aurantiacum]
MSRAPRDRAVGALVGLALGDALGMPTQNLPRDVVRDRYGDVLDNLHPGPDDNQISRGLPAGRVTDDTDQAVLLGELFVAGNGRVDPVAFADRLLRWAEHQEAIGSADLLGPSTRRALTLLGEGVPPEETGRWGDTNGAAMRIAPIGVGVPVDPLPRLVDAVAQASGVTHSTGVAIAGAAAVAAAVSAGIDGSPLDNSLRLAVDAARLGAARGSYVPGADVAARITWALELVGGRPPAEALDLIYRLVGTGLATQEAVPAALAVAALFPDDLWDACRHAASLGGDCDTVAAMTGAVVGAHTGAGGVPHTARERLRAANPSLELTTLADQLLALR